MHLAQVIRPSPPCRYRQPGERSSWEVREVRATAAHTASLGEARYSGLPWDSPRPGPLPGLQPGRARMGLCSRTFFDNSTLPPLLAILLFALKKIYSLITVSYIHTITCTQMFISSFFHNCQQLEATETSSSR